MGSEDWFKSYLHDVKISQHIEINHDYFFSKVSAMLRSMEEENSNLQNKIDIEMQGRRDLEGRDDLCS